MNYFALFIKKTLRFLLKPLSFVPAVLVMVMIFSFSAQNGEESSALSRQVTEKIVHSVNYRLHLDWTPEQQEKKVETLEFYVRKTAHFSEYCLLAITLAIPLYVYGVRGIWLFLLTELIVIAYALGDEYHQNFSAGRSPQLRDVVIDSCGGFFGILLSHPLLVLGRKTIFAPLSLEKERNMKKAWEMDQEAKREDEAAEAEMKEPHQRQDEEEHRARRESYRRKHEGPTAQI